MAELIVSMDGYPTTRLGLELYDAGDDVEVWRGVFFEDAHLDTIEVYFEVMDLEYEIWDLVNLAIEAYKQEVS